jgi:type II secretion system protein J
VVNASRITPHAFTLVEILIAIGIFSLVLASIYSAWSWILRAERTGRNVAETAQRARVALRTLEDSITSVQSFQQSQRYYAFVAENGSEASLSFVARLAKSFPRGGRFGDMDVRRVTFSLESGPDNDRELVLRQQPVLLDLDADEKEHPLVLARNVKGFAMEFWDARLLDWVDEWKETNQIPKLIKVTLTLADNSRSFNQTEQITRLISVPSEMVVAAWQWGRGGGAQPQPRIQAPGQPPVLNPGGQFPVTPLNPGR